MQGDAKPAPASTAVETLIETREREIVRGFRVRRALPSARRRMVGPFIFVDQMGPEILAPLAALPGWARHCIEDLLAHARTLAARIEAYDEAIRQIAREDARVRALMQLPGLGPTTASALVASLGAEHDFSNGRQVAAWLGLELRQAG